MKTSDQLADLGRRISQGDVGSIAEGRKAVQEVSQECEDRDVGGLVCMAALVVRMEEQELKRTCPRWTPTCGYE